MLKFARGKSGRVTPFQDVIISKKLSQREIYSYRFVLIYINNNNIFIYK